MAEIAALAGFLLLAYLVRQTPYFAVDLAAARAVQSLRSPAFDSFMRAISWPGFPPQVLVTLALLLLAVFLTGRRREALYLVAAIVGVAILAESTKILIDRPRPPPDLIYVVNPNVDNGRWGYPAGHAADYLAIYGFVFYIAYSAKGRSVWRWVVMGLTAAAILLVGVSRVYMGEHWVTDVVGGYLLGGAWLAVVIYWYRRMTARVGRGAP